MFIEPAFNPANSSRHIGVFGGINLRIPAAETGGLMSVWEGNAGPGEGPPLHVHTREDEMFYVLDGTFEFRCGDETFVGGPGTSAVLPRNVPHTFRNIGETAGRLICAAMPGGFEDFFLEVERSGIITMPGLAVIAERHGLTFLPDPVAAGRRARQVASTEGLSRDEVFAEITSG